jgi:ABC-type Zn uptake system ZnuABC Zn-binding protein ZnuA
LTSARNPRILPGNPGFLEASEGCDILEKKLGVDRSMGDVHPFGNPHYWLDPENGRTIARNIAKRLSELDPSHKDAFAQNESAFETRLNAKEKEWEKLAAPLKGSKVVFYHNSWSNFTKRFGLEAIDFIEPKPGIPPSPAHIQSLGNQIKKEGVSVLLIEPYFDAKLPEKIAHDTGARVLVVAPSVGAVKGVDTYTDLFDYNLKLIGGALGGQK